MKITQFAFLTLIFSSIVFSQNIYADSDQEKLEFAQSLEETLGHFWAIEQNLDEQNADLALVHATHPISELYDIMKPELSEYDPELDSQVRDTLIQLQNKASTKVSREQAQMAIDEAKEIIEIARSTVVGDKLSADPIFKAKIMKGLLETSIAEYHEAVSDGKIIEMAEFQDGSAFVWKSEQIFKTIENDIDPHIAEEIEEYYEDLWDSYEKKADPTQVETFAGGIIHEVEEITGIEEEDSDLLEYVENIRNLLSQTKTEYGNGNNDVALSLATKAYLDNFEFLEAPLVELGQEELMEEVEIMLREDLRQMIRDGEPASVVNSQVDSILEKMDTIATIVPEFGPIAIIILAVSIISIIAITSKSKFSINV